MDIVGNVVERHLIQRQSCTQRYQLLKGQDRQAGQGTEGKMQFLGRARKPLPQEKVEYF